MEKIKLKVMYSDRGNNWKIQLCSNTPVPLMIDSGYNVFPEKFTNKIIAFQIFYHPYFCKGKMELGLDPTFWDKHNTLNQLNEMITPYEGDLIELYNREETF